MVRRISLKQLQREVDKERSKIRSMQKRENLQRELKKLRRAGRTDVAGRIGRGFLVISKKTGKAAVKQARLIRERQIKEAKRTKGRRGTLSGRDDIFAPLDF